MVLMDLKPHTCAGTPPLAHPDLTRKTAEVEKIQAEAEHDLARTFAAKLRLLADQKGLKTNKEIGKRAIQKYTKLGDPEVLADSYLQASEFLEGVPYVSRTALATHLAQLAETESLAKAKTPEDFIEMRFVSELERAGFFKTLWGQR